MNAILTPLRRLPLRIRLRTLLLLIAVLAMPCAWIGSQAMLARDRSAMLDRVRAAGGVVSSGNKIVWVPAITIKPGNVPAPISAVRRWFGDRPEMQISVPHGFPDGDEKRILDLFPEAEVVKFWPPAPDDSQPRAIRPR